MAYNKTCILLLLMFCGSVAIAESSDERFMAGLRERQLYRLACQYCRQRLADDMLPETRRTELSIELARSLAEWAVASPPAERGPRWEEALSVLHNDLKNHPANPQAILLRLQEAHVHLARGELAREEARLAVEQRPLLDEARVELRAAVRLLRQLNEDIATAMRQTGTAGELSTDQLASLEKNVRYETARALRNQGECFAARSADRANSAAQAGELLEPLTRLDTRDPLCWKSRIDQVACMILAGDYGTTVARLDALDSQEPPPLVALRLRALRMETALADDQLPRAVALLSLGRQVESTVSARLDYAWLKTCLTAWRSAVKADKKEAADGWQAKANKMVRLIGQTHGPYWARRAEMLAGNFYRTAGGNQVLDTLVYAAESSYRSGRPDDALTAYDKAVAAAQAGSSQSNSNNTQRAFDLAFTAAMIEQKRGRHEHAASRLRQLALDMPEHARAADAHLQAIWNAGKLAKQPQIDVKNPNRHLQHYTMLLEEHLRIWPDSPTANQARWLMGRLAQHRADWPRAVAAYRSISLHNSRFGQAVRAADQCYANWLEGLQSNGEPTAAIARQAADWFESLIAAPPGVEPENWKAISQEASLAAASLRLNFTPDGFARAQQVLTNALDTLTNSPLKNGATAGSSSSESRNHHESTAGQASSGTQSQQVPLFQQDAERRSEFETLLVLALAGQGRRQEASELLRRISGGWWQQLLGTLARLDELAVQAGPSARSELAGLVLQTIDTLRPQLDKLTPAERRRVDVATARAMANVGRVDEAVNLYRTLIDAQPTDVEIHKLLARLLADRQDRGSLQAALREWRLIEKRLEKGKGKAARAAWFRAKLEIARLHVRLGNRQRAAKMIELMSILHPDLGGEEMKRRFEKVLGK